MAKNEEEDGLAKLMRLTKLMKEKKVKVSKLGPQKTTNKWRSADPKFAPKTPKSGDVVRVGEMDVDPALQQEYENWRKDKMEQENDRRELARRKAKAARDAADEARGPRPGLPPSKPTEEEPL